MTQSADHVIAYLRRYLKYVTNKCEISFWKANLNEIFASGAKITLILHLRLFHSTKLEK